MKRFVIVIIICVVCGNSHATTPYAPRIFANDSWAFVAGFAWPDQNGKVLIIRTAHKTSLFSRDELGINTSKMEIVSTAGYDWYHHSIGHRVTSLKVKLGTSESRLHVFCFRHRDGKEAIIDLNSNELIDLNSIVDKNALNKITISKAASLLKSDKPQDRQTAAIHLGQLGASEYLQELTNLLNDKAAHTYTRVSTKEEKTVYYVRDAAKKAIELINSKQTANRALQATGEPAP